MLILGYEHGVFDGHGSVKSDFSFSVLIKLEGVANATRDQIWPSLLVARIDQIWSSRLHP